MLICRRKNVQAMIQEFELHLLQLINNTKPLHNKKKNPDSFE